MNSVEWSEGPVEMFYLVIEPHSAGYRWIVRQFGKPYLMLTGNETFGSEDAARKAGKAGLIAASARAKATRQTGRRSKAAAEAVSEWIG